MLLEQGVIKSDFGYTMKIYIYIVLLATWRQKKKDDHTNVYMTLSLALE